MPPIFVIVVRRETQFYTRAGARRDTRMPAWCQIEAEGLVNAQGARPLTVGVSLAVNQFKPPPLTRPGEHNGFGRFACYLAATLAN